MIKLNCRGISQPDFVGCGYRADGFCYCERAAQKLMELAYMVERADPSELAAIGLDLKSAKEVQRHLRRYPR
jgi:hypothetical protein